MTTIAGGGAGESESPKVTSGHDPNGTDEMINVLLHLRRQVAQAQARIRQLESQSRADHASLKNLHEQARIDDEQIVDLEAQIDVDRHIIEDLEAHGIIDTDQIGALHIALQTCRRIGAALGVLMATHKVTEAQAFEALESVSLHQNRKLRDIAEDVLRTGTVTHPSN